MRRAGAGWIARQLIRLWWSYFKSPLFCSERGLCRSGRAATRHLTQISVLFSKFIPHHPQKRRALSSSSQIVSGFFQTYYASTRRGSLRSPHIPGRVVTTSGGWYAIVFFNARVRIPLKNGVKCRPGAGQFASPPHAVYQIELGVIQAASGIHEYRQPRTATSWHTHKNKQAAFDPSTHARMHTHARTKKNTHTQITHTHTHTHTKIHRVEVVWRGR